MAALATYLEECGRTENATEIEEKTTKLLELYRGYEEKLSKIVSK